MPSDKNKSGSDIGVEYNPEEAPPVNRAEAVRRDHETRLMQLPGVTGVGLGRTAVGDDAIIVYLVDKSAGSSLPKQIDGIEIVTEITGIISAQQASDP